jgi:phosphatidylserine decarboxylase
MDQHPQDPPPRRLLPLAAEGLPHIGVAGALWLLLGWLGGWPGALLGGAVFALTVNFFRDPERTPPPDPNTIVAPADGRIIQVGEVEDARFFGRRVLRISIFMSPLDVHVNRIPTSGTVGEVRYHPGKYLRAFADKASLDNEQNALLIEAENGQRLWVVQIAGFIARRIVCKVRAGDRVERGQRYGMILFGSRADVYLLPEEVAVAVEVGQKARAGETVLARWR